jgi:hypothetical protein
MSFSPVLAGSGLTGWMFLRRTLDSQQASFARSPVLQRDADHFRARIGEVRNADDLLSDRRMLRVALGAFGLDDDLPNRAFIRRVLSDNPANRDALVNRLADKRYLGFSQAFGLWSGTGAQTGQTGFADRILEAYRTRQFEQAVGNQDEAMRLVLNARRELGELANRNSAPDTAWFNLMGSPPLRRVMETALGLPRAVATLDIDQQLGIFRAKARAAFGNGEIAQFSDPERMEALIRRFLVRSQFDPSIAGGAAAGIANPALQLLQQSRVGAVASLLPLASRFR